MCEWRVAELTDIVDGEWRSELTLWTESDGVNLHCGWTVAE